MILSGWAVHGERCSDRTLLTAGKASASILRFQPIEILGVEQQSKQTAGIDGFNRDAKALVIEHGFHFALGEIGAMEPALLMELARISQL